ncbi:hypothetical protein PR048_011236 [Dryococelus australis]|uniref:Uncharacterized protein n=1 Tax=Dryococelus australis TaxID=614101 RepID=A0ABQ9HLI7_9NEOP|nr:hypothetical protein PR048_011236 [Dryococelus australis]
MSVPVLRQNLNSEVYEHGKLAAVGVQDEHDPYTMLLKKSRSNGVKLMYLKTFLNFGMNILTM